jgi:hypothetical protein
MSSVIVRDGVCFVNTSIIISQELREEVRRQKRNLTELIESSCRAALGMDPLKKSGE